jgi:glycosyltransferase involved in cell wall biosynthesis
MKGERITVCVFGQTAGYAGFAGCDWKSGPALDYEETGYTVVGYDSDSFLNEAIKTWNPNIFVTFGPWQKYTTLTCAPFDVRQKWVDGTKFSSEDLGKFIMKRYLELTLNVSQEFPKVSIFTTTYKTGTRILRPLNSIIAQTYDNWEWIIVDDSPGMENFDFIQSVITDPRIKVFKPHITSGRIGEVKKWASALASGTILVEIDHDDEFTNTCLELIVKAFKMYPNAGFAYTDCCEVWESTGENFEYASDWGLGFGSYRDEEYNGKTYRVTNYPDINSKTIRHIVGCPNHARAWRKNLFDAIGGFNPDIHVADDYDLMLRTFLTTRMVHIKKFGYIQYKSHNSQTVVRNREIQRLVRYLREYYDPAIHNRCLQLNDPDIVWVEKEKKSNIEIGKPKDFMSLSLNYPYP